MGGRQSEQKDTVQTETVSPYIKVQQLVDLFRNGPLMANATVTNPIEKGDSKGLDLHVEQLKAGLVTIRQIIDTIDRLDESEDKAPLFQELIKIFSHLRYHSLMRSAALNRDVTIEADKLAPICSEDEFKTIRRALAPTLPNTLSKLPVNLFSWPLAGKAETITAKPGINTKDALKPDDLVYDQTHGFLGTKDRDSTVETATTPFFNPLEEERSNRILSKFLHCIAHGKQDEAEKLLKISPKWLLKSGIFTDYSGRRFECPAYLYAYWSKDTHMCRMLEKYMDAEISTEMLSRIDEIERIDPATGKPVGLTYYQNDIEHHSAHFDFTPLKNALQAYINGYDTWCSTQDWTAMEAAWMRVGLAQRDVPAHVAQEYCRPDRSFDPTPSFKEAGLPRVLTFYNYNTGSDNDVWFPLTVSTSAGLGFDFALILGGRAAGGFPGLAVRGCGAFVAGVDLAAVSRLDEVRTVDLTQSRENLTQLASHASLVRR